jgi:hypothetical protein
MTWPSVPKRMKARLLAIPTWRKRARERMKNAVKTSAEAK